MRGWNANVCAMSKRRWSVILCGMILFGLLGSAVVWLGSSVWQQNLAQVSEPNAAGTEKPASEKTAPTEGDSIGETVRLTAGQEHKDMPRELTDYVAQPDEHFTWSVQGREERWLLGRPWGTIHTLQVRSQRWQGVVWQHEVIVYIPPGLSPGQTWLLWIDGDLPPRSKVDTLGMLVASQIRAPFAMLFGVPNQPLLGDYREDALIAETLARYLQTQRSDWPLLFPMVKSVIRCMDALQGYAQQQWGCRLERFVLSGASKRGWTAWLTAATGDPRVQAIAPLVFDTLNLPAQMAQQVRVFGRFSEMIHDYQKRGLLPIPNTSAAQRLWAMIDPWTYCPRLRMPKLIINGTNDPYWPLDALNLYWEGLPGDKWVLYVPNAGHYMCERRADGAEESLPRRAVATLTSFAYAQIHGRPLPRLQWHWQPLDQGQWHVQGHCDQIPCKVRLFTATSDSRDFRQAWWQEHELRLDQVPVQVVVPPQAKSYSAAFVEVEFASDGRRFTLSSPLRVWESSAHRP
ncbi:MAG: PhoPQ-activated protein PqaA family protein [Thermogemmata sp.]